MIPRGLGTGHSRPTFAIDSASASICKNVDISSSVDRAGVFFCVASASHSGTGFLLRLLGLSIGWPSAVMAMFESAKARRGAGQGKTCGRPTMTTEASMVAANKELVERDRGCRIGGIMGG